MEAYRDNVDHPTVVHRIFHDPSYGPFRTWHQIVNFFIYLSCIAIAIESVDEIEAAYHNELNFFEWVSVVIFTIEYFHCKRPDQIYHQFLGLGRFAVDFADLFDAV